MAKQIGHKPPDGRSGRIGGSGSHGSGHTVLAVCDRHGVPSVAPQNRSQSSLPLSVDPIKIHENGYPSRPATGPSIALTA
jgi:hypothetical protein